MHIKIQKRKEERERERMPKSIFPSSFTPKIIPSKKNKKKIKKN